MKYSELPKEYKELGDKYDLMSGCLLDKDDLNYRFSWKSTTEGYYFWDAVHYANSLEDLPRLIAPKYWAIELDSDEIREEVVEWMPNGWDISTLKRVSLLGVNPDFDEVAPDWDYYNTTWFSRKEFEEYFACQYTIITHEEFRRLIKPTLEKPIEQRVDEAIVESKKESWEERDGDPLEQENITREKLSEWVGKQMVSRWAKVTDPAKPNKSEFYVLDKDAYIKALEDYIAIKG